MEAPHGIPACFIFTQNLRNELAFGQLAMLPLYVLIGGVHPESECLVHSEFHLLEGLSISFSHDQN
jgi:hypothetical protein